MNDNIYQLLDMIVQGRNVEATELLNQELISRAHERIEEIKPEVAAAYFSPVINDE